MPGYFDYNVLQQDLFHVGASMLRLIKLYAFASCAVGALQVVDGIVLFNHSGIGQPFNSAFSMLEGLWVLVSIVAIVLFVRRRLPLLSPISFVIYNVLGWVAGFVIVCSMTQEGKLSELVHFAIPLWAVYTGTCFGIYFLAINVLLCKSLFSKPQSLPRQSQPERYSP